jgi:hypothetical protein
MPYIKIRTYANPCHSELLLINMIIRVHTELEPNFSRTFKDFLKFISRAFQGPKNKLTNNF